MLRRTKDRGRKRTAAEDRDRRTHRAGGAQRDLYESIRLAMQEKVRAAIAAKGSRSLATSSCSMRC